MPSHLRNERGPSILVVRRDIGSNDLVDLHFASLRHVPEVVSAQVGLYLPADENAAVMWKSSRWFSIGAQARVRQEVTIPAPHMQIRFKLPFPINKTRHWFPSFEKIDFAAGRFGIVPRYDLPT